MKINKILIMLLIMGMLTCGLTAVFAQEGTLPDGTKIPVPEGYEVKEFDKGPFFLVSDDQNEVITISNDNPDNDPEAGKQNQIKNGATFESEKTININGVDVIEQRFNKDGFTVLGYIFSVGDKNYVIVATTQNADWNAEDTSNPVNIILTSLLK